ncbi:MAG: hypothetical protein DRH03_09975 [Deltaproteobacteria bacterium]|nr:MAG: hypothetical protein DRH03_09975 [Deltaproteobacteria bacterium]
MKTVISTLYVLLVVITPAIAGNAEVVYKSGILVSVFVGVCALIVVAQLVPVLMLIVGFIKASVAAMYKKEVPAVESAPKGN